MHTRDGGSKKEREEEEEADRPFLRIVENISLPLVLDKECNKARRRRRNFFSSSSFSGKTISGSFLSLLHPFFSSRYQEQHPASFAFPACGNVAIPEKENKKEEFEECSITTQSRRNLPLPPHLFF